MSTWSQSPRTVGKYDILFNGTKYSNWTSFIVSETLDLNNNQGTITFPDFEPMQNTTFVNKDIQILRDGLPCWRGLGMKYENVLNAQDMRDWNLTLQSNKIYLSREIFRKNGSTAYVYGGASYGLALGTLVNPINAPFPSNAGSTFNTWESTGGLGVFNDVLACQYSPILSAGSVPGNTTSNPHAILLAARQSAMSVLQELINSTLYEVRFNPTNTVDFLPQVGSTTPVMTFTEGANLLDFRFQYGIDQFINDPIVCLPEGGEVITENGILPINEVQVGDMVYTHRGRFRKITEVFKRRHDGQLIKIRNSNCCVPLRLTPDHPVLVSTIKHSRNLGKHLLTNSAQWTKAEQIAQNLPDCKQFTVLPCLSEVQDREEIVVEHKIQYLAWYGRVQTSHWIKRFPCNSDLMTIIGYYLAEGFPATQVKKGRKTGNKKWKSAYPQFSLGKELKEFQYAYEIVSAAKNLGLKSRIEVTRYGVRVTIYSAALAKLLVDNFGKGASKKKIPIWALMLPKEKLEFLFKAYMNGDGHYHFYPRDNYWVWTANSVSRNLIEQMRLVALKLGYKTSVNHEKIAGPSEIQDRQVERLDRFVLHCTNGATNHGWVRVSKEYQYLRVIDTEVEEYHGLVYNLAVEEDNSYCTPAGAVHNCGAGSATGNYGSFSDNQVFAEPTNNAASLASFGRWSQVYSFPNVSDRNTLLAYANALQLDLQTPIYTLNLLATLPVTGVPFHLGDVVNITSPSLGLNASPYRIIQIQRQYDSSNGEQISLMVQPNAHMVSLTHTRAKALQYILNSQTQINQIFANTVNSGASAYSSSLTMGYAGPSNLTNCYIYGTTGTLVLSYANSFSGTFAGATIQVIPWWSSSPGAVTVQVYDATNSNFPFINQSSSVSGTTYSYTVPSNYDLIDHVIVFYISWPNSGQQMNFTPYVNFNAPTVPS